MKDVKGLGHGSIQVTSDVYVRILKKLSYFIAFHFIVSKKKLSGNSPKYSAILLPIVSVYIKNRKYCRVKPLKPKE
ncbi:hypothetical protein B1222_21765 [Paenibacillus larvae subsp. pulvifaciens]|nr:hypothetical protein BXP28_11450 [Paenibacillus larvae subsp. larvae]AQT86427.1 hypothetical protein B1222_21765 [Paenibacillus larvae subsp. pulvifaciens]ETK27916.1 hypothetical protein ERIC1_1c13710 [Paenibacillus larvae subsp. larvae DSM 25719]MBH0344773.1 hypothetical protein [Paenibacillus larvae]